MRKATLAVAAALTALCLFVLSGCSNGYKIDNADFEALPDAVKTDTLERMDNFALKNEYVFDSTMSSDTSSTLFVNFVEDKEDGEQISLMYYTGDNSLLAVSWFVETTELQDTLQGDGWIDLFHIRDKDKTLSDEELKSAVEELFQESAKSGESATKDVGNYNFYVRVSDTSQYIAFYNSL